VRVPSTAQGGGSARRASPRAIADAVALRRDVLRLPERTDGWRVVHGDGDRFPDRRDRYGPWVVVQITTFAAAQRRTEIADALLAECGATGVWERA